MNGEQKNSDYIQTTYTADGEQTVFVGKNAWVKFDFPPTVLTKITICEIKGGKL